MLLHSQVDPDHLGYEGFQRLVQQQELLRPLPWRSRFDREASKKAVLCRNAWRAEKALRAGRIKPAFLAESIAKVDLRAIVDLREFHDWSTRVRLPMAGPWPQRNEDENGWVPLRFPHSTQGLELMQRVAKLAHGEAKEVWLTNRQTSDIAVKLGASRTQGDVIASLLRPDDLPRGRRPRQ